MITNHMTLDAVSKLLSLTMRLMTVQTIWFVSMSVVTEGTVDFSMGTRDCINFLYN